ncbi:MAG: transposase [Candidatus Hadarchaeales archaeon]
MKHVGLDVHRQACHATVMDETGRIERQERFKNSRREYERFSRDIPEARVAMEASCCWQPVYELLGRAGHSVKLAHPKRTYLSNIS